MINLPEPWVATPARNFAAAIKVAQSISAKTSLDQLLETALNAVMSVTGAYRGWLILEDAGELAVAARCDGEAAVTGVHPPIPVAAVTDAPHHIIYHARQTGKIITITAGNGYGDYAADPYLIRYQPPSLLCAPLLWEEKLVGVIYMEGNVSAFTADHVQLVEMLATQTAISLINIRRYEALRQEAGERQQAEEMLRIISAGTAAVTGADFFRSLVHHLATILQVKSAFITECTDETMERVRTLAFLDNNAFADNYEYDLEGTTCEGVIAGSVCYYAAHVHEMFPKEKGIESYLGVPVHNSAGDILGHLAVCDVKPMPDQLEPYKLAVLQIFAARAGAELDRIRAYEALQKAKDELEIRVVERTAELSQTNSLLKQEIAERERVEEALRVSEQSYRDLYEKAPNVYVSVGVDGRIKKANRRAVELFGYSLYELLGKPIFDLVADSPAGLPVAQQVFARLLAGQETQGEEVEFRHADGRQIYCSVWVRPMRSVQGEIVASRSIIVDITQRKRMEAEREKLIDELDAFAHTVAHDLKNPLTGIMAYAELLQTNWATDDERQRATDGIVRDGHKMNSIIKELLLLAEMRQVEDVECRPLEMDRIVQEARQRLLHLIESEQVEFVLPAVWPVAQGYGPWIEEVWANYLSNGIKYGGRPRRLELGATVQLDNMVRFWVRDNGRGLAADEQVQLFTPFTRLNQVQVTGHGLGLSIVQRIVGRLGGRVGVESEVGRGSTFWFTLPGV